MSHLAEKKGSHLQHGERSELNAGILSDFVDEKGRFWAKIQLLNRANFGKMRHLGMIFKHYGYPGNPIGGHLSNLPLFFFFFVLPLEIGIVCYVTITL